MGLAISQTWISFFLVQSMMPGSISGSTIVCHPRFYYPNGSHIFQVKDTLYRLDHLKLEQDSETFRNMFKLPIAEDAMEGKVDEVPIFLVDLTVEAFDL